MIFLNIIQIGNFILFVSVETFCEIPPCLYGWEYLASKAIYPGVFMFIVGRS